MKAKSAYPARWTAKSDAWYELTERIAARVPEGELAYLTLCLDEARVKERLSSAEIGMLEEFIVAFARACKR
jgi:hypothetical protein